MTLATWAAIVLALIAMTAYWHIEIQTRRDRVHERILTHTLACARKSLPCTLEHLHDKLHEDVVVKIMRPVTRQELHTALGYLEHQGYLAKTTFTLHHQNSHEPVAILIFQLTPEGRARVLSFG